MATEEQYFAARRQGEPVLAVLLFAAACGLIYAGVISSRFFLLLGAAVLIVGSVAAWCWRRFRSEVRVSAEGVFFSAQGMQPTRRTNLAWSDLTRVELRIEIIFRCEHLYFYDFFTKGADGGAERRHSVILNGLQDDRGDILSALYEVGEQNGYTLTGPRPDHISAWFSGMNWKINPAYR